MTKRAFNLSFPQGNKTRLYNQRLHSHILILFTIHLIRKYQAKNELYLHLLCGMSCKGFIPTAWVNVLQFVWLGMLMFVCVNILLLQNWQIGFVIFSHPFSFQKGEINLNEVSFLKARFSTPCSPIKSLNDMNNLNEYKKDFIMQIAFVIHCFKEFEV